MMKRTTDPSSTTTNTTSSSSSSNSAIPASVFARGRLQDLLETHATNSSELEVVELYQVLENIVQIAKSRK